MQLNHIDPDGAGGADIQHVIETWLKQQARFRLPGDRETVIYPLTFASIKRRCPVGCTAMRQQAVYTATPNKPEAHANTWVQGLVHTKQGAHVMLHSVA